MSSLTLYANRRPLRKFSLTSLASARVVLVARGFGRLNRTSRRGERAFEVEQVRERNMIKNCKIIASHAFPLCFLMLETGPVLDQAPNNIFFLSSLKFFLWGV